MTLNETLLMRVSGRQVSTMLADGAVILNTENGMYYSVNRVGALLWQMLDQPQTLAALHDAVLNQFDVTPETCANDVQLFVEKLQAARLIEVSE